MHVLKCLVGFANGYVGICDGIKYNDKLWLVPSWLKHPTEPIAMPVRIIRFDNFPHQVGGKDGVDYQNIQLPIPESALCDDMPLGVEYENHPQNLFVSSHELNWH